MERAWREYGVVPGDGDGVTFDGAMYRVVLGSGERMLPSDARVATLARSMYHSICSLSVQRIFEYIMEGNYEHDVFYGDWATPDRSKVGGGSTDDLPPCTLLDVSPELVQFYWGLFLPPHVSTLGTPRSVLRFPTREQAMLAVAIERFHTQGTAEDVLRCLSRSLHRDAPMLRGVIQCHALTWPLEAEVLFDEEESLVRWGRWRGMVECILSDSDPSRCSRLVALHEQQAYRITVVHHTWRVVADTWDSSRPSVHIVHRKIPELELVYTSMALAGGTVMLHLPAALRPLPPWMERHNLPCRPSPPPPVTLFLPLQTTTTKRKINVDALDMDSACSKVVKTWERSELSRGVNAPYLLSIRPFDALTDGVFDAGDLRAVRDRTRADLMANSFDVFRERFGEAYALGLVNRSSDDDRIGVYCVRSRDGTPVAAFAIVIYDSVHHDGRRSVAVMIDSFAVCKENSGCGIGGVVFHELLRQVVERYANGRYVVFAQCVKKGNPRLFWCNKLDETSCAKSLLIQALHIDADRVLVQAEGECTPRSREFYLEYRKTP